MGFNRQQKLPILLLGRCALRHTQHELLTRTVDIRVQKPDRQTLVFQRSGQVSGDGGLTDAALSGGHSHHVVRS